MKKFLKGGTFIYRLPTILLSGFLTLTVSTSAWGQQPQGDYHGIHMMWDGGWGYGMFFGPMLMVIFFGILIAVLALLVRRFGGSKTNTELSTPPIRGPHDILSERFARGEIDKDEYEERRHILND